MSIRHERASASKRSLIDGRSFVCNDEDGGRGKGRSTLSSTSVKCAAVLHLGSSGMSAVLPPLESYVAMGEQRQRSLTLKTPLIPDCETVRARSGPVLAR